MREFKDYTLYSVLQRGLNNSGKQNMANKGGGGGGGGQSLVKRIIIIWHTCTCALKIMQFRTMN